MDRKKTCADCPERSACTSLCADVRAQLPTIKGHTGVALYGAWPLCDDLFTGSERRPVEMASYAEPRLLKLAESIRWKFTSREWSTVLLVWARGLHYDEAAVVQRVTEIAIQRRIGRVLRILRKHFVKNNS